MVGIYLVLYALIFLLFMTNIIISNIMELYDLIIVSHILNEGKIVHILNVLNLTVLRVKIIYFFYFCRVKSANSRLIAVVWIVIPLPLETLDKHCNFSWKISNTSVLEFVMYAVDQILSHLKLNDIHLLIITVHVC